MKKLALVVFIVLAAAGLWWWESPRLATENLLDAAQDGDVQELATLVDTAAFSASLRTQIEDYQQQAAAPPPPAPLRVPAGDPLVSTLWAAGMFANQSDEARASWDIDRQSVNRFRVNRRAADGRALAALLFARDGLHWKLVGIDVTP